MGKSKPEGGSAESPKLPIPKDGLRARNLGRTWWGRRWLELLEQFAADFAHELEAARLSARQGRVRELRVEDGIATAEVVADRRYRVELRLVPFAGTEWERVARVLVEQAGFEAALLARQLPEDLAARLEGAGLGLLPPAGSELTAGCQCFAWTQPCEHVLAAGLVLGTALDEDPLLLFELRGRARAELLADLSRHRAEGETSVAAAPAEDRGLLAPEAWAGVDLASFRAADPALEGLAFRFDAAAEPLAVLQRLGPPPDVDERLWQQRLGTAYLRAAERALELALEQRPRAEPADEDADGFS